MVLYRYKHRFMLEGFERDALVVDGTKRADVS
jgi:hypothetical protein